jgi:hypothetical protein
VAEVLDIEQRDGRSVRMARMIAEVYHAFKAAGVDDQIAQAAATAMTQRDDDLQELRKDFQAVRDEFKDIKSDMKLLNWKTNLVLGLMVVLVVQAVLLPLFR